MWCEDEAGPFSTVPYPGSNWQPQGKAACQDHEYIRNGTAKLLTLFHPATGQVRVKGVTSCTNAVLHHWLQEELATVVQSLPTPARLLKQQRKSAVMEKLAEGFEGALYPPARLTTTTDVASNG